LNAPAVDRLHGIDLIVSFANQPFSSLEVDELYLHEVPKTHGYLYLGIAVK